jgi:hypothetical protein
MDYNYRRNAAASPSSCEGLETARLSQRSWRSGTRARAPNLPFAIPVGIGSIGGKPSLTLTPGSTRLRRERPFRRPRSAKPPPATIASHAPIGCALRLLFCPLLQIDLSHDRSRGVVRQVARPFRLVFFGPWRISMNSASVIRSRRPRLKLGHSRARSHHAVVRGRPLNHSPRRSR